MGKKTSVLVSLLLAAGLLGCSAVAAFYLGFSTMGMTTISSINPAEWTVVNTFGNVDVTNASQSTNETIRLLNSDSNITYEYSRAETITPEMPAEQCNITGDITISAELNGAAVNDGDIVVLETGISELVTTVDVAKNSCPGNVTIVTDFIEQ
jgi:uncharacterized protein (UPF0333 family)